MYDPTEKIRKLPGHVGLYYKNLVTGEEYKYNADKEFQAASVIKLPIFMYISKLAAEGKADFGEKILIRDEDKFPSCGALLSFTGDVEADILTLCKLMITISDNTATNALIRKFTIEGLQAGFEEMGLKGTKIKRELFDAEAEAAGRNNIMVPEEIGMLLEQIYRRTFVNEKVSQDVESVLLLQQIRHKIPGYIGRKFKIANKTGEDGNTTNDAGVVYSTRPFIFVFASNDTNVMDAEIFIRETAYEFYKENI